MLTAALRSVDQPEEATAPIRRCWLCGCTVAEDEATIAPTVCARCYSEMHEHWR